MKVASLSCIKYSCSDDFDSVEFCRLLNYPTVKQYVKLNATNFIRSLSRLICKYHVPTYGFDAGICIYLQS